ncbi:MAG: hypothetical protein ABH877_04595 [bacterium]
MRPLESSHQLELRTEELAELGGVVSLDLQTTAPFGTPKAESRYDEVPADPQSCSNGLQVRLSVDLFSQEVEDGTVVPHVDLPGQAKVPRICDNPRHLLSTISQARPSHIQSGLGNVGHDDIAVALL